MRELLRANFASEVAQMQTRGNRLTGYASVFDYPIDSGLNQTTFVRPGAFTRTLKNNRDQIQVLFNHGMDHRYGELPIGTIRDLKEDNHGLWAEVELHNGPDNENIRSALASGALRAMSIQFEAVRQSFNDDRTERNLEELKLWEFGPVTFPANEAATASLHSALAGMESPEPESLEGGARLVAPSTSHGSPWDAWRMAVATADLERQADNMKEVLEWHLLRK